MLTGHYRTERAVGVRGSRRDGLQESRAHPATQAWLAQHPRFVFHHPPVHCSWMNQVELWFGILQRNRLTLADFPNKAVLAQRLAAFIAEWNQQAHPCKWSSQSATKVMAWCERKQVLAA
jgi:hypothetical protein